ncbi:hypothetical protein C8245_23125 [Paracidovorax avenae]|uniref:DUF1643 domain-containing protein n=1 Tax=Paracidovorax avenae TaxID=80867 RepID=UPI000D20E32D|nr:DUF1643 domain-containing protein [Paracidovorax avenae]AVS68170.1 hypothetical protein C8245_23125 [Paracidovorax avenae]
MSAVLSPCGLYRYRLERQIAMDGPVYAFFGINPSTADANLDDATVRKWIGFCKRWGASRLVVGNVWPLRSTDVRALASATRWLDVGRENQRHVLAMAAEADVLVPCWGDRGKVPRAMHNELDELLSLLRGTGKPVRHFGLTKGGDPKHPLMLGYDTQLAEWPQEGGMA